MSIRHSLIKWLGGLFIITALLATTIGAYHISPWRLPFILWERTAGYEVLVYIRLPRIILTVLVGSALGLTGASLQGLFRNPLADPGLIGITAGAALGASLWIVLIGSSFLEMWGTPMAAFGMGSLVSWCVWKFAQVNGRVETVTLLLSGIALTSFAGAGIGIMTFMADDQQLRSLTFWLLGSVSGASWSLISVIFPFILVGMVLLLRSAPYLNILSLGESEAYHLGVSTESLKFQIVIGSALLAGAAVSAAGGIGFVGLVVPHLIRMIGGADHRLVLPASALGGAILLMGADLIARTIIAPMEMPVGTITALLGAPFFLLLLWKYKRETLYA